MSLDVPDRHGAVEAPDGQFRAIGTEGQCVDAARHSVERRTLPAGREVPDPDFPVGPAGGDAISVRMERDADDLAIVPVQDQDRRPTRRGAGSQIRTVASAPAEASFDPSGLKATPKTAPT